MFKGSLSLLFVLLFCFSAYAEDVIVAKVNGVAFTMKDLENEVDRIIPKMTFHRDVSPDKRKRFYKKALEELVNRELEYQDALAKGFKINKESIDEKIAEIKKRYIDLKGYESALQQAGLTEDGLRTRIEKELLIKIIVEKTINEPSKYKEEDLKQYYEKNLSKFKRTESVKLRILSTNDEKKAQEMLKKIKAGEDLGNVAYEMSEDDYRVKGGDIGYVHKGRLLPEIESVAFKINTGEMSDVFKAEDKWYIIKVEDKKPEHTLTFDEVKEKLKKESEAKKSRELIEKWLADLKAKAKVEILLKTDS